MHSHHFDDDTQPAALSSTSASQPPHVYAALTPDVVLDALAGVGLMGDGRMNPLASYENRVYQVWLDDGRKVVAKFYRPGRWSDAQIDEEHAFSQQLTDAEVPVVAPLILNGSSLHHYAGFSFSVSPWRGGRQPDLDDWEVLEWTGRFLARIHTVGAAQSFVARPHINVHDFGLEPHDWLMHHHAIAPSQRTAWSNACLQAIDKIRHIMDAGNATGHFAAGPCQSLRLHGDCHPGNVLWVPPDEAGGGPHFVDLDDARTGPAVQDMWMLLSGDRAQQTAQLSTLVEGYEQFRPFDRRELVLIEPLRTLRLIHYSAWLARRFDDPIFPIHFPWFGSDAYWQEQTQLLHAQIEAMDEEPLHV
ncbi:Ser/Thr protein kinase RdoA (MazF antagonist) [Comamonas odontotermitis]|uniref:Stress response kinase A n=1 Tax=Comamonas odontotermitis TaxID=379895 RepID=A0ABR6RA84_9BURK|nr:serine/threonine protein kinase [Comamonas odontotermitis]MBB6576043.1 Ser/Thr protein kinase RdoA (MazF antagonist) [Comamonas odontotermitis]